MRCDRCKGARFVIERVAATDRLVAAPGGMIAFDARVNAYTHERPCPDCHGSGAADCCSGATCEVEHT